MKVCLACRNCNVVSDVCSSRSWSDNSPTIPHRCQGLTRRTQTKCAIQLYSAGMSSRNRVAQLKWITRTEVRAHGIKNWIIYFQISENIVISKIYINLFWLSYRYSNWIQVAFLSVYLQCRTILLGHQVLDLCWFLKLWQIWYFYGVDFVRMVTFSLYFVHFCFEWTNQCFSDWTFIIWKL